MDMKYFSFLLGVALLFSAELSAGSKKLDKGGVSFPMEKISAERFAVKAPAGKNLIKNGDFSKDFVRKKLDGWSKGRWMFGEANRKKFFAKVAKITEARISVVDGKRVLDLNRPIELENLVGSKLSGSIYISATQRVALPDAQGGRYKLSFSYRTQKIGSGSSSQGILVYYLSEVEKKGKNTRSYQVIYYGAVPNWTGYTTELTVPAGTKALDIAFRSDGCGRTLVKDVALTKINAPALPVTIEVTPMKMLDNVFALASGDPGILGMRLRNNLPKGKFKERTFSLGLELPAHVEVLGANSFFGPKYTFKNIKRNGKDYKVWELPFTTAIPALLRSRNTFTGWHVPSVMIRSNAKAGQSWECSLYVTQKGKMLSARENFTLRMIPALPQVAQAKRFLPGFSSVSADIQFRNSPAAREAFARFITQKSGTRWITASIPVEDTSLYRKYGVKYVTAEPWAIANGYRIGRMPNDKKPAYSIFRDLQGRPVDNHGVYATCPAAIYLKTPYYKEIVVPMIKRSIAGFDGFTPNWEPYTFRNRGCFCDTCKKEFAKYAKIPAGQIDKIWPGELQIGKKYRDTAIRFRGWQHGEMILTLHKEIMAAGGKEVGMCPEVGTDQVILYDQNFQQQWEFGPYNYAGRTKWLNVWGPYIWFIGDRPYVYTKGAYVRTWEALQRVVRDYTKTLPQKRAKLLAMPHGNQVNTTALGQPEGMAMDQISAFLAGFHASQLYFFPRGYDHRFWGELGRSSRLIALTEDMVMTGKRIKEIAVVPVTPFPSPVLNMSPRLLPDIKKSPVLQAAAFVKGDKILAAVGNFWEKGDVIFKLQLSKVKANESYCVREVGRTRQFTKAQGKLFSGSDLQKGILLHAGALRWVFFEIAPCKKVPALLQLTAADMAKAKTALDKSNKAAAAREAALDRALMSENDFGSWQNFKKGGFECKVVDPGDKNQLQITAGKNTALVDPRGLVIHSLKINGAEQVHKNFGMSCFWNPGPHGMQAFHAFKVTEQKVTAQGLRIVAECTTSGRSYPALPSLNIVRVLNFNKDLTAVTIETILKNTTEISMEDVGFRWYFMPAAWDNKNGGFMEIGGKKILRPHGYSFFKKDIDPASEAKIRRIFIVKNPSIPIKGNVLTFKASKGKTMTIDCQAAGDFGGVAVWDTADLFAATCEPFYKPLSIAPGGKVSFKAEIRIK